MRCYSIPHTVDPEKIAQKIPVKDPVFYETADRLSKGQDLPDRWTVRCTVRRIESIREDLLHRIVKSHFGAPANQLYNQVCILVGSSHSVFTPHIASALHTEALAGIVL